MNRKQLYYHHDKLCANAKALMQDKNADYGENDDPFRNFREFGQLGILVRLSDKLARLRTWVERGVYQVKSEKVEDVVLDVINYAVLFSGYGEDGHAGIVDIDGWEDRGRDNEVRKEPRSFADGPMPNLGHSFGGVRRGSRSGAGIHKGKGGFGKECRKPGTSGRGDSTSRRSSPPVARKIGGGR